MNNYCWKFTYMNEKTDGSAKTVADMERLNLSELFGKDLLADDYEYKA